MSRACTKCGASVTPIGEEPPDWLWELVPKADILLDGEGSDRKTIEDHNRNCDGVFQRVHFQ
jgi:hypothetical protein